MTTTQLLTEIMQRRGVVIELEITIHQKIPEAVFNRILELRNHPRERLKEWAEYFVFNFKIDDRDPPDAFLRVTELLTNKKIPCRIQAVFQMP